MCDDILIFINSIEIDCYYEELRLVFRMAMSQAHRLFEAFRNCSANFAEFDIFDVVSIQLPLPCN